MNKITRVGMGVWGRALVGIAAVVAGSVCALGQVISAVPVFPGGGNSTADAMNADGTAAAGYSNNAGGIDTTLRWTVGGGSVNLGLLPGGAFNSYGEAMSSDGTAVAGYGGTVAGTRAFRWTTGGGYQVLPMLPGATFAQAHGISASGAFVVGESGLGAARRAFLWNSAIPPVSNDLGVVAGQGTSAAMAISPDGSTVVGESGTVAFRWTGAGGMQSLGSLPGQTSASAYGASTNGSIIAGTWRPGGSDRGFRWTQATGMVDLGLAPGGTVFRVRGISGNGSAVVGQANGNFGFGAAIWTQQNGVVDLATHLANRGVNLTGWTLTDCNAVNADATAFAGVGIFAGQSVGWVVRGLNVPVVSGSGAAVTACPGFNVGLAAGSPITGTGLQYQWYKNGVPMVDGPQPSGSLASGSLSQILVLTSVTAGDAGTYWAIVSAQGASPVQGPSSTITIRTGPAIVNEPADTSVCQGSNVSLTTSATNPNLTLLQYRWQKHVPPFPNVYADIFDGPTGNGSTFSGTGTATMTINGAVAADTERYRCVVTDLACGAVTAGVTRKALVTVTGPTVITQQPVATQGCQGDNDVTFTVAATPTGQVTYQWQRQVPPFPNVYTDIFDGPTGNGGNYGGAQTAILTIAGISPADAVRYRCVVTGPCSVEVSSRVPLTVVQQPAITIPGASFLVCPQDTVGYSIVATGGGLSYQWQFRGVNGNPPTVWTTLVEGQNNLFAPGNPFLMNASGVTTPDLLVDRHSPGSGWTTAGLGSDGEFQCIVSNACDTIRSPAAGLTVFLAFCPRECDSLDFNKDGNIDPLDVDAYFSVLGEGPCLPTTNECHDLDFNNDGNIDPTDVDAYFSILGEGPCL